MGGPHALLRSGDVGVGGVIVGVGYLAGKSHGSPRCVVLNTSQPGPFQSTHTHTPPKNVAHTDVDALNKKKIGRRAADAASE